MGGTGTLRMRLSGTCVGLIRNHMPEGLEGSDEAISG
jgi:hypothetical protein